MPPTPGTFTWDFDAPEGVYKNHALSGQLLELAAQDFVIVPFTQKVPDFGPKKGESITLVHYKNLPIPASAALDASGRIPVDRLQQDTRLIKVAPFGRAVEVDSLSSLLSHFDPFDTAQKKLKIQMTQVMDITAAAAFRRMKVSFTPTSATGGTIDTDGTPSVAATSNLTKKHCGILRDYLATNLHAPFYEGNHYIGLFTTKALRGLKNDSDIALWHQYLRKGDLIFNSEIGLVESIRMVEVTQEEAFSNSIGTAGVTGEGVVFGDEAVSRVEAETPHLRLEPNFGGNFGLQKACAWYGVIAYATTWDSANDMEAKGIRWGSL